MFFLNVFLVGISECIIEILLILLFWLAYDNNDKKSDGDDSKVEMHFDKKKVPWDSNEHPVTDTAAASSELAGHDYKSSHPPKKPLQSKIRQYTADGSIENLPFSKNYSSPYLHSGGRSTHTNGENAIDEYCYHTVLEKHGQIGLHLLSRKSYRVYLHCSEEPKVESPSQLSWLLFFSMVRNISDYEDSVHHYFHKSRSPMEQLGNVVVQFNEGAQHMKIVIDDDQLNHQRGWCMHQVVPMLITKKEVVNYVDGCPPQFNLLLIKRFICNPCDLTYKFVLDGVGDNKAFITIHKFVTEHEGKLFRALSFLNPKFTFRSQNFCIQPNVTCNTTIKK